MQYKIILRNIETRKNGTNMPPWEAHILFLYILNHLLGFGSCDVMMNISK